MTTPEVKDERPAPAPVHGAGQLLPSMTALQWLEVAAAVAVVLAITPTLIRRFASPAVPEVTTSLASFAVKDSVVPTLLEQPIWGPTLGNAEGPLSNDARAIRLGAAIVSFELRYRRADSSMSASAGEVATLIDTFAGGSTAADGYRALGASKSSLDAAVQSAAQLAEKTAGKRAVRLGAWLQGARFASAMGDSTYFGANAIRAVSRAAITIDARAETESAARQFEQIARARPWDWIALATAVDELLRLLGTA
jgi:hypothetical protein